MGICNVEKLFSIWKFTNIKNAEGKNPTLKTNNEEAFQNASNTVNNRY